MGVHYDHTRAKHTVRWTEDGRRRIKRFDTEQETIAFDETVRPGAGRPKLPEAERVIPEAKRGDGIYSYETAKGRRWRFAFRQSDGTLSSRRGFTSRTAAAAAKRRLLEEIRRGEMKVSRESFEAFWSKLLADKRPYMTAGSHQDFATHGRKRLVPFFGGDRLSSIDEERVRNWLETMTELVETRAGAAQRGGTGQHEHAADPSPYSVSDPRLARDANHRLTH